MRWPERDAGFNHPVEILFRGMTNSMGSFVRHVCWDLGSITYNLVQDIYHTDLHFLICKAAAVSLMLQTLIQIICR